MRLLHENRKESDKMANKDTVLWIIAVILGYFVFMGQPTTTTVVTQPSGEAPSGGGVDLCTVVQPTLSFTGQRMFQETTALTSDWVRIIKENNGLSDLSSVSMNSGTKDVEAKVKYKLYYGLNSSATAGYYPALETIDGPCTEATTAKIGKLCLRDTAPSVTIKNDDGDVQAGATNAQALGADEVKTVSIKIQTASKKCYGNPQITDKQNIICFKYNTTGWDLVSVPDATLRTAPQGLDSTYGATGFKIACYEFKTLKDNEQVIIPVKIDSAVSVNPLAALNISIYLDDVDYDLDAYTLQEIRGYEDETFNDLGVAVITPSPNSISVS